MEYPFVAEELKQARGANWSRYWATGALHSCAGSFSGNYAGAIARWWLQSCKPLALGSRVLDLASGNGPLPRLMLGLDGGDDLGLQIDAVDLAEVAPAWANQLDPERRERLRFHAQTDMTCLPFADAQFDLVVSQYGIEYAPQPAALSEALRVLKPAGSMALLMHHKNSLPVQIGRSEFAFLGVIFDHLGFFTQARALVPWLAMATTAKGREELGNSVEANEVRGQYNAAVKYAVDCAAANPAVKALCHELLQQTQALFASLKDQPLDSVKENLDRLELAYRDSQLRSQELVDCALDESQIGQWRNILVESGRRVEVDEMRQSGQLMGWTLSAVMGS